MTHLVVTGWDKTNHFYPVGMGIDRWWQHWRYYHRILKRCINHCTVQVVVKKLNGYDTPNLEGSAY